MSSKSRTGGSSTQSTGKDHKFIFRFNFNQEAEAVTSKINPFLSGTNNTNLFMKNPFLDSSEVTEKEEEHIVKEEEHGEDETEKEEDRYMEPIIIEDLKPIGEGSFGRVYNTKMDEMDIAIKMLTGCPTVKEEEDFLKEIVMLKNIEHNNILTVIGYTKNTPRQLITEFAANGDLLHYVEEDIDNQDLQKLGCGVASALHHLQTMKIVHRDLAARNILVTADGIAKIADFGLARYVDEESKIYKSRIEEAFPKRWTAIEALLFLEFSSASDVWSFGVVLWEMISWGAEPYDEIDHMDELLSHLLKGNRLSKPDGCTDELYAIMQLCWSHDAQERPSPATLIELLQGKIGRSEQEKEEEQTTSSPPAKKRRISEQPLNAARLKPSRICHTTTKRAKNHKRNDRNTNA